MDVGQSQSPWPASPEPRQQPLQAAARPGIDDHVTHEPGADHMRAPQVKQIYELRLGALRGHGWKLAGEGDGTRPRLAPAGFTLKRLSMRAGSNFGPASNVI